MEPATESHDKLAALIDAVLREQPLRRAPPALESRVFAAIGRHATQSWWRNSFWYWPLSARAAFLLASAGAAMFALKATTWLAADVHAMRLSDAVEPYTQLLRTATVVTESIVRSIPSLWMYGVVMCIAAAYAAFFGISAAAYRTLYAHR